MKGDLFSQLPEKYGRMWKNKIVAYKCSDSIGFVIEGKTTGHIIYPEEVGAWTIKSIRSAN